MDVIGHEITPNISDLSMASGFNKIQFTWSAE